MIKVKDIVERCMRTRATTIYVKDRKGQLLGWVDVLPDIMETVSFRFEDFLMRSSEYMELEVKWIQPMTNMDMFVEVDAEVNLDA